MLSHPCWRVVVSAADGQPPHSVKASGKTALHQGKIRTEITTHSD